MKSVLKSKWPTLVHGVGHCVNRKATDAQILEAYAELSSVVKVGRRLGMCGQSVHDRLVRLNAANHTMVFTDAEAQRVALDYNRMADEGRAWELAKELGRTPQYLCRQARKMGITRYKRDRPYLAEPTRIRKLEWFKRNPHPRGMLGKSHSDEFKDRQSERSFVRWHSMTKSEQNKFTAKSHRSWKAGWRDVGGKKIFFRSRWEANYARYLEWLKGLGEIAKWEHEPHVFWFLEIKRGTRSYLPDFKITENNGSVVYHEVKGWMDPQSKTKIKRMAKYHPQVKLIVIGPKNYKALENMVSRLLVGWERSK